MVVKLRRIIHVLAAEISHHLRAWRVRNYLVRWLSPLREIRVLCFHRVLSEEQQTHSSSLGSMVLKETTFQELLSHLDREFSIINTGQIQDALPGDTGSAKPLCILTFDDGWKDNYCTAYPLLKKYGITATIFLATGVLETQSGFWVEQLVRAWKDPASRKQIAAQFQRAVADDEAAPDIETVVEFLKRKSHDERQEFLRGLKVSMESKSDEYRADQMLTWEQVKEMSSGGIEFGSHTVTHPLLTYEKDVTVRQELIASKQIIQEKLGKEVRAFAYPNGDWDERIRRMVKDAGYQIAFTTERGLHRQGSDPYTIKRIMLHEGNVTGLNGKFSPAMLGLRLSGWY